MAACQLWSSTSRLSRSANILPSSGGSTANTPIVATAAAAGGIAAANSTNGGAEEYYSGGYGVAWDQFYDQNYQLIWSCRDKATGQFVYDYQCGGQAMVDTTWPGWRA